MRFWRKWRMHCIIKSAKALCTINKHGHKLVVGEVRPSIIVIRVSFCGKSRQLVAVVAGDGLAPTIDLLNHPFTIIIIRIYSIYLNHF